MHHHDPFRARPTALLGVASHTPVPTYGPGDVPTKASEAVAWLRASSGADAVARAHVAKAVEDGRDDPRSTVLAAIDDALAP